MSVSMDLTRRTHFFFLHAGDVKSDDDSDSGKGLSSAFSPFIILLVL